MEKLPAQMTVIGISRPGGPEVLLPETRPIPKPGPDEILIKVLAAGANRPDGAQRMGHYPPPPGASDLPGLEVAGEVVAVGSGAKKHKVGDKVIVHLTNSEQTEDATHGFAVPTKNVMVSLDPGETTTVEFVADRAGTYSFYCTEFCSALHLEMQGWLIVEK